MAAPYRHALLDEHTKKETRKEHNESLSHDIPSIKMTPVPTIAQAPMTNAPSDDFFNALESVSGKTSTPPSIERAVVDSPVIVKYGIPGPFLNDSGEKEETEEKPDLGPHR